MKIDPQLYTRLCKIHQLSMKGVGGEADNARQLLSDLLERNGLSMADFEAQGEAMVDHTLAIGREHVLFKLFVQVASALRIAVYCYDDETAKKVMKATDKHLKAAMRSHLKEMLGKCLLRGTASQIEEFKLQWEIYSEACMEEIKTTVIAFIHANRIFPPDDGSDKGERPPLTEIQKRALMRAMEMESVQIRRRLN